MWLVQTICVSLKRCYGNHEHAATIGSNPSVDKYLLWYIVTISFYNCVGEKPGTSNKAAGRILKETNTKCSSGPK